MKQEIDDHKGGQGKEMLKAQAKHLEGFAELVFNGFLRDTELTCNLLHGEVFLPVKLKNDFSFSRKFFNFMLERMIQVLQQYSLFGIVYNLLV